MNLKDRGNKKWTAMMLIEHRKRLKELKESEKDRERPELDDQEKTVINSRLQQAVQKKLPIEIKYYEDKRFKTITGTIKKININKKIIFISDQKIKVENLLGIKLK